VATGFISNYVAKSIHKWVNASVLDKSEIVELMRNPFSYDLLGGIFKEWMETALGTAGKVLRFSHQNNDLDFTFSDIHHMNGAGKRMKRFRLHKFSSRTRFFLHQMTWILPRSTVTQCMMISSY